MTYLPLYLHNAFGLGAAAAGFGMLPFALPLFFCPRIAAALAMRVSGRVLLTVGLAIVALGNIATPRWSRRMSFMPWLPSAW